MVVVYSGKNTFQAVAESLNEHKTLDIKINGMSEEWKKHCEKKLTELAGKTVVHIGEFNRHQRFTIPGETNEESISLLRSGL